MLVLEVALHQTFFFPTDIYIQFDRHPLYFVTFTLDLEVVITAALWSLSCEASAGVQIFQCRMMLHWGFGRGYMNLRKGN